MPRYYHTFNSKQTIYRAQSKPFEFVFSFNLTLKMPLVFVQITPGRRRDIHTYNISILGVLFSNLEIYLKTLKCIRAKTEN